MRTVTDALILDYATPAPSLWSKFTRWAYRRAIGLARWSLQNRPHLAGVVGCAVAVRSVSLAWGARIVLGAPVHGGCGTGRLAARADHAEAGVWLLVLLVLWLAARRSWWSVRLARSSFAVAAAWWLYTA